MGEIPEEIKDTFVDGEPRAIEKVKKLKGILHEKFPVYGFRQDHIERQNPLDLTAEHPLDAQHTSQESFMDIRSRVVLGRDKLLSEIEDYILNDTTQAPLLLVGTSGSGKSAIMARTAATAMEKAEQGQIPLPSNFSKWQVFYHFVGATPGSTDLSLFLQRLTRELNTQKDVLSDLDSLVQLTNSLMSNSNTKPSIIILDAINQFDDDKIQYLTRWLPEKLSPNIRLVVSMIDETDYHRLLRSYRTGPKEIICGELDYSSRKEVVRNILKQYNRQLDDQQMSLLLEKRGSANPLWLSLACEELRVSGYLNTINEKIISLADELLSLEEQVLTRFENENGSDVVRATLCLLETSRHGLLETELLQMLGDETLIVPPNYNEYKACDIGVNKEEKAATATEIAPNALSKKLHKLVVETCIQKDDKNEEKKNSFEHARRRKTKFLSASKWDSVYRALKPLLRPCGNLGEGRLDFYHRSISKAVRRKYFSGTEGSVKQRYTFWHGLHASFFEQTEDFDRKSEELPYHLERLLDKDRLTQCLLEWPVFERLYSEDFSFELLRSWQKAGGYAAASQLYKESINSLRDSGAPLNDVAEKLEKIIIFLIQAGQYKESFELLEDLRNIEEQTLGSRVDNMADIYQLMGKTKSEMVKNINFVTNDQIQDDKEVVEYCKKSLRFRKELFGEEHQSKTGLTNIVIAHHLSVLAELDKKAAKKMRKDAFAAIDEAIGIFEKLGDIGHLAEAIMTKSFIDPREEKYFKEKEKMLLRAYELCRKTYGEKHSLNARIYLNTGILYEDNKDYEKAYDFFVKWHDVQMEVLGPSHPKSIRAKETLAEPTYARIRRQRERQAAGTA